MRRHDVFVLRNSSCEEDIFVFCYKDFDCEKVFGCEMEKVKASPANPFYEILNNGYLGMEFEIRGDSWQVVSVDGGSILSVSKFNSVKNTLRERYLQEKIKEDEAIKQQELDLKAAVRKNKERLRKEEEDLKERLKKEKEDLDEKEKIAKHQEKKKKEREYFDSKYYNYETNDNGKLRNLLNEVGGLTSIDESERMCLCDLMIEKCRAMKKLYENQNKDLAKGGALLGGAMGLLGGVAGVVFGGTLGASIGAGAKHYESSRWDDLIRDILVYKDSIKL